MPRHRTLAALYGDAVAAASLVLALPFANLSLLPGGPGLDTYNVPDPWLQGEAQFTLRDAVSELADDFDMVLVDCPPMVYLSAWAALVASDGVVIPLQAEDYGSQGIPAILESIDQVRRLANPRLQLLGYLVSMFNKSLGVHQRYERDLRELYGEDVFGTMIPLATDMKEAVMHRLPISSYKPRSVAAKALAALGDELLARLVSDGNKTVGEAA